MQELTSLTVNPQRRAVAVVTTVTIQTLQDAPVSSEEVTTTLTEETGIQAAVHLATTPVQLVTAGRLIPVAQVTIRLRVAAVRRLQVRLQAKVEALQAAVVINS